MKRIMLVTANITYTLICGAATGAQNTSRWPQMHGVKRTGDASSGV